jgi:hypothetical protein
VRISWLPNPEPSFYTPRGTVREVSFTEGERTVSVPVERLHGIEDLWPELVRLASPRPGDYRLYLPCGVGAGPSEPVVVIVTRYRFVDLRRATPERPDETRLYRP